MQPNTKRRSLAGLTAMQRWAAKVSLPEADGGCWLWFGATTRNGYGQFAVLGGKRSSAHRYAFERFIGPVPEGLELDHLCRVRACCNPAHLEAVTHAENISRSANTTKTHCKYGHPFSGDNLIVRESKPKYRRCRECKIRDDRGYKSRKRLPAPLEAP